ncbi:MAG TPA: DUF1365 domain-containing protein [Aliidongia sp.]|uniref:DUF1365 domain-containing protein n=1 Tax=Aliidongia sp. TaxID=1914230 RepID=UPI002DDD29DA|nr:DUF1365 domain-containing protein [Aliidongia sp.]HEV2675455.1 DUF1365 domain-containing protein [Aliidongia sp.]
MTDGTIYFGDVMHRRLGTVRHRFTYRVFSILVDLDRLETLGRRLQLFSYNRPNLFSFHDRDHGPRDGSSLRPWVEEHLAAAGLKHAWGGRIRLLCFPRLWGYVFNPLSVFFCEAPDGQLAAILYEVSNTFGERHCYLEPVRPGSEGIVEQACAKRFYVSPFIELEGDYRFRVLPPAERLMVAIRQRAKDGQTLHAILSGKAATFDDRTLVRALLRYPLMTVKVMAAIHWEALRLWRKGAKFQARPALPPVEITYGPGLVPATSATRT